MNRGISFIPSRYSIVPDGTDESSCANSSGAKLFSRVQRRHSEAVTSKETDLINSLRSRVQRRHSEPVTRKERDLVTNLRSRVQRRHSEPVTRKERDLVTNLRSRVQRRHSEPVTRKERDLMNSQIGYIEIPRIVVENSERERMPLIQQYVVECKKEELGENLNQEVSKFFHKRSSRKHVEIVRKSELFVGEGGKGKSKSSIHMRRFKKIGRAILGTSRNSTIVASNIRAVKDMIDKALSRFGAVIPNATDDAKNLMSLLVYAIGKMEISYYSGGIKAKVKDMSCGLMSQTQMGKLAQLYDGIIDNLKNNDPEEVEGLIKEILSHMFKTTVMSASEIMSVINNKVDTWRDREIHHDILSELRNAFCLPYKSVSSIKATLTSLKSGSYRKLSWSTGNKVAYKFGKGCKQLFSKTSRAGKLFRRAMAVAALSSSGVGMAAAAGIGIAATFAANTGLAAVLTINQILYTTPAVAGLVMGAIGMGTAIATKVKRPTLKTEFPAIAENSGLDTSMQADTVEGDNTIHNIVAGTLMQEDDIEGDNTIHNIVAGTLMQEDDIEVDNTIHNIAAGTLMQEDDIEGDNTIHNIVANMSTQIDTIEVDDIEVDDIEGDNTIHNIADSSSQVNSSTQIDTIEVDDIEGDNTIHNAEDVNIWANTLQSQKNNISSKSAEPVTRYEIRETSNMEADTVAIYKEKLDNLYWNKDKTPALYDTLIESITEESDKIKDENSNKKAQLQKIIKTAMFFRGRC